VYRSTQGAGPSFDTSLALGSELRYTLRLVLPAVACCARFRERQVFYERTGIKHRMHVELRDSESFDQLLRRFTKGIERSGVIREHRRGLRFISTQEENRAKRRKAERRRRRTQS
jgi:small subunit ribosomal protein S21